MASFPLLWLPDSFQDNFKVPHLGTSLFLCLLSSVNSVGNDKKAGGNEVILHTAKVLPVINMSVLMEPFSLGYVLSQDDVFRGHSFSLGCSGRKREGKAFGSVCVNGCTLHLERERQRQHTCASVHCQPLKIQGDHVGLKWR